MALLINCLLHKSEDPAKFNTQHPCKNLALVCARSTTAGKFLEKGSSVELDGHTPSPNLQISGSSPERFLKNDTKLDL